MADIHNLVTEGDVDAAKAFLASNGSVDINAKGPEGSPPLLVACGEENAEMVELLLGVEGVDVNGRDEEGNTPLHVACFAESEEMVGLLLKKAGIDVNAQDGEGKTPLHAACYQGSLPIVELLLSRGDVDADIKDNDSNGPGWVAVSRGLPLPIISSLVKKMTDINSRNEKGKTLLHLACSGRSVDIVSLLLDEAKANINALDAHGNTPLHIACLFQTGLEVVSVILGSSYGADLSVRNNDGNTALHIACESGNLPLVSLLLEAGKARTAEGKPFDVNARNQAGKTPLFFSCPHPDILTALLNNGADPFPADNEGETPLFVACAHDNLESIRILSGKLEGSKVDSQSNKEGRTALFVASATTSDGQSVNALLSIGADPTHTDAHGATPLHSACLNGNVVGVQTLLSHYPSEKASHILEQQTDAGDTPLSLACLAASGPVVSLLIKHKANVNAKDKEGNSALQLAASRNAEDVIKALLGSGSLEGLNGKNAGGDAAIHIAAQTGGMQALSALLKEGSIDVNIENAEGNTPLHLLALREDGAEGMKLLLDRQADPNKKNQKGNTPLHVAAAFGYVDSVRTLMRHGASAKIENEDGITPADMSSNPDILALLK